MDTNWTRLRRAVGSTPWHALVAEALPWLALAAVGAWAVVCFLAR